MTIRLNEHNQEIARECQRSPEVLRDTLRMVIISIREKFHLVEDVYDDVLDKGIHAPKLFGFKVAAWEHVTANYRAIHRDAMRALHADDTVGLMRIFLRVPGLGLAKAGFAVQLLCGRVGCIDTHNARIYNVPESMLRFDKSTLEATQTRKIEAYIDLCKRVGGSRALWDSWCDLIADRYPNAWSDGRHVSAHHVTLCVRD
jgi:hypothetical protein